MPELVPDKRPPELTLTNWDLGGEPSAWAYRHAGELFPAVEIAAPRRAMPLEIAAPRRAMPLELAEADSIARFAVQPGMSLEEYVASAPVSGIVIVLGGRIVFERYPRMCPGDRHLLMSVTKVFVSAIVGILERRGLLDLGQPVDAVLGELAGSCWTGVTVGDVLDMASGIDCLEIDSPGAYSDPGHPFYRFEASLGWRPSERPVDTYALVAGLPSHRKPGQVYEYTSVNTFVLSWLVERVTGLSFAEVFGREIWSSGGFEAPAQLCTSPAGTPASHGGLSTTLRDLARFGMLFTPSVTAAIVDREQVIDQEQVIDREHLRRIQAGARVDLRRPAEGDPPEYMTAAYGDDLPAGGRQWDFIMDDGDLFKGGFGGQGLYISPGLDLVIAFAGTPREDGSENLLRWFSRRLALSIGSSGPSG